MNENNKKLTLYEKERLSSSFNLDYSTIESLEQSFSYKVLFGLLFFFEEQATLDFFKIINDFEQKNKIKAYFEFLDKYGLLTSEYIPESILFFEQNPILIDELLSCNTVDDGIIDSIIYITRFAIDKGLQFKNIEEIKDSRLVRFKLQENDLELKNAYGFGINAYKRAMIEVLFGDYPNITLYRINGIKIPDELQIVYQIEQEILNETDIDKLNNKFTELMNNPPVIRYTKLKKIVDDINTTIWNNQLSNPNDIEQVPLEQETIERTSIKVYKFNGQPFKFLAHVTSTKGQAANFANKNLDLANNPEMWDSAFAATTISTSLISDTHISLIDYSSLVFGFNSVEENQLLNTKSHDALVSHENGKKVKADTINFPNHILAFSNYKYNEVCLKRVVGDKRKKPDFVICFDGIISEQSKLAAQYFNIPIYMINRQKYNQINDSKKEMYDNFSFKKFDETDIDYLLYASCLKDCDNPRDKVQYCIRALKYAYKIGIVNDSRNVELYQHIISSLMQSNFNEDFINYVRELALINTNQREYIDSDQVESLFWRMQVRGFKPIYCFMDVCMDAAEKGLIDIDKVKEVIINEYINKTSDRRHNPKAVQDAMNFANTIDSIKNSNSKK